MSLVFDRFLAARTFRLVRSVSKGSNIVKARLVFKWKTDANGEMVKAKARLVAQGLRPKYKLDLPEEILPTANTATTGILVALATTCGWDLNHFDVEQALSESDLWYEMFMRWTLGFRSMSGKIVRRIKSL